MLDPFLNGISCLKTSSWFGLAALSYNTPCRRPFHCWCISFSQVSPILIEPWVRWRVQEGLWTQLPSGLNSKISFLLNAYQLWHLLTTGKDPWTCHRPDMDSLCACPSLKMWPGQRWSLYQKTKLDKRHLAAARCSLNRYKCKGLQKHRSSLRLEQIIESMQLENALNKDLKALLCFVFFSPPLKFTLFTFYFFPPKPQ